MRSNHSELPLDLASALDDARDRLGAIASEVHYLPTTGSTNDVALSLAAGGCASGAVVVADQQTSGRGRRGRSWFSPPGSGLYVSVVLTPSAAPSEPERATRLLTLAVGVALAEGVEAATGLAPDIKWPNDLTVGRRKLAGILTEAVTASEPAASVPAVVTGFGINVGASAFPPELGDRATSLEVELSRPVDRAAVLAETLAAVAARYEDLLGGRFDAVLDAWRRRAPACRGAAIVWSTSSGPQAGVTAGIADDGALLVHVRGSIERIVAGEIRWN